ncbi:YafY family protein [Bacillus sp. JCM 19041]|uniref:helix-turn-helix transcriptional regulator n=1 Tax=Bacillus sp. JCM 19041 TaxID=1460637 RepID=UPI0006D1480B
MKVERLISIIYKLLNHEVLSASTLANEFQVSQRTIYRDIDAICSAGIPVIAYQGQNGGYGIIDGYKMDKSLLGSHDVDSLITVLTSLSSVFEDENVQGTIERLQTVGTKQQVPSLLVDLENKRSEPEALNFLRTGIKCKQVVRFDYFNRKSERTTRDVEPIQIQYKYRNWYIHGYCRTRQMYREFRLSRMVNLILLQEFFQPHNNVLNPNEHENGNLIQTDTMNVVIKVEPEALSMVLDQFQQAEKEFHFDGSMTMNLPVYKPLQAQWLWSILLSFGSGAEVLEPFELRDILKEQLIKTLKRYEEV